MGDTGGQLSMLGGLEGAWKKLALADADVRLRRDFLRGAEAERLFNTLLNEIPWKRDKIKFFGKEHDVPRLHQWYGDEGLTYKWSGITMHPEPWSPLVMEVRQLAERAASEVYPDTKFNTVLLNLYRTGEDSVSWHADDEPELGDEPVIGSVSLGAERDFMMRHNDQTDRGDVKITLPHGSLLLMAGATQSNWKHAVLKRKSIKLPRINLTFRFVDKLADIKLAKRRARPE